MVYSKNNPFYATIKERHLLTGPESGKRTWHVVLDLKGSGITYRPGDCISILPTNCPSQVEQALGILKRSGDEDHECSRSGRIYKLRDYLLNKVNLETVSKRMRPLMPRFYSIASSQSVVNDEVHLTVRHLDHGVCTDYLCDRIPVGEPIVPIYVQPTRHFLLPDHSTDMIMVGPGTGVAPYRGFLQERLHMKAKGRQWLFFGEQTEANDFLYADYWRELANSKRLHLATAFSRDQEEKIYVQHKMEEHSSEIWAWIEGGAHFYVCGDAKRMAKDVEATLKKIIEQEGCVDPLAYVKQMRKEKRYLADVY